MVARDGIEPPTPAFSGPRSTTELSGLGLNAYCGERQEHPQRYCFICARPIQGSSTADGSRQRKCNSSIATLRHTANSPCSRYPCSSSNAKVAPYGSLSLLPCLFLFPALSCRVRAGTTSCSHPGRNSARAACRPGLRQGQAKPTRAVRISRPYAERGRSAHAPFRGGLRGNLP